MKGLELNTRQCRIRESNPCFPDESRGSLPLDERDETKQWGRRDSNPDISVPETDDSCQLVYIPKTVLSPGLEPGLPKESASRTDGSTKIPP